MPGRSVTTGTPAVEDYTGHELDVETGMHYAGARYYMSALGRWNGPDPLLNGSPAGLVKDGRLRYLSASPYNYVFNNPTNFVDPYGMDVRCEEEADCQQAAEELNEVHDGETNITVTEAEWEESDANWWNPFSWGDTKTVSGFKLSTAESNFDFGKNKYTSGLYDVISSEEKTFDLNFVPGETNLTGHPLNRSAYEIQGRNYTRPGGGTVLISADGNRLNEPTGVVLMHEMVGHGHPAGGTDAHAINRHYQSKLGYALTGPRGIPHGGYKSEIGWTRTGLYRP